jgi:DNA-directed RNA polymerase subunit RPC12/RpoP
MDKTETRKDRAMLHCPNCNYVGKGKKAGASLWAFLVLLVLLFGGVLWMPLWIVFVPYFIWLLARSKKIACPNCNARQTLPLDFQNPGRNPSRRHEA